MTLEEAMKHSGYVQCAWVMLRDDKKRLNEEDPENVRRCVKKKFGGNVDEFVEWAADYLGNAYGVKG